MAIVRQRDTYSDPICFGSISRLYSHRPRCQVGGVIYPSLDFPNELYSEKKLCPILSIRHPSILKEAAEVSRLSARTVRDYVKPGEIRGRIIRKACRP
jgi:hypothetical protein